MAVRVAMAVVLRKEKGSKLGISRGLFLGMGLERLVENEDKEDEILIDDFEKWGLKERGEMGWDRDGGWE